MRVVNIQHAKQKSRGTRQKESMARNEHFQRPLMDRTGPGVGVRNLADTKNVVARILGEVYADRIHCYIDRRKKPSRRLCVCAFAATTLKSRFRHLNSPPSPFFFVFTVRDNNALACRAEKKRHFAT